jgi:hypothetical protein
MYLETLDRRSSRPAASAQRFPFTRKRPARTPPSTFLFLLIHFSNSPEVARPPFPANRKAVEAYGFRSTSEPKSPSSVRCFGDAPTSPKGGRHVVGRVYRSAPLLLSTQKLRKMRCGAPFRVVHRPARIGRPAHHYICAESGRGSAALKPHSCDVLSPQEGSSTHESGGGKPKLRPERAVSGH